MAPTLQNDEEGRAGQNHHTSSTGSFQKAYKLHRQRSTLKPWRRQNRAETSDADTRNVNAPYKPEIPLHAKIIPHAMTSESHDSRVGHLSIVELILISLVALMIVVIGIAVLMMRSIIIKKVRRLFCCCGGQRQVKKSEPGPEDKGVLVMGDEFDDPTWGTPTRLVYVEGLHERFEERCSTPPNGPPSSFPAMISLASLTPISPRLSAAYQDDSFKNRFEYEEHDITLALTRALRDATDIPDFQETSVVSYPAISGDLENPYIFDVLRPDMNNLSKGTPACSNRPRQCSDASASSRTTTVAHSDCTNIFSVPSPDSSMTSLESSNSSLNEGSEEMEEAVYEVRRAHAQSLELKKGILVTCSRTSSTGDVANPGMLPTFLISEAPPNLMPLDDLTFAPLFSLGDSMSSKASLPSCTTTPSWSSIVRENSRGTMASLSSSSLTTAMDGWTRDDEKHLHPPIPFLMLTRPSDSSIYTAESSASSVSIDLCDFPLPPIPETSHYSNLVDQVQHAPKRLWDNHSADSSMAQKRSTVERFIKMYSVVEEN